MSSIIPAFDPTQDWTSPAGLNKIKTLIEPHLSFEPYDFQVYDSGCILNGRDVFCISATGDGKSALIYIPALIRKDVITVVVEPMNALENNIASSLKNKGLTAIVINAEEIEEAKDGQYQVVALSPEMLKSREYSVLNNDPYFRQRWRVLVVDEAHLVDHWGTDFRKAYADIWALCSRGPEHLTFVAMSATVEMGMQMKRILQRLGYHKDTFHLDKRDCERHNVDLIFRTVQFTCTGFVFRDLDWLVPSGLACASDVPKRIVYSDTIEIGHHIAVYLRGLLPSQLQSAGYSLIRHMHSMNCPECKKEGLAALNATANERTTAIFVATAVWEVGLDVPDIDSVILFPAPASASSIVQRAGRPARTPEMCGEAYVYVKKTDIEAALEYAQRDPPDSRLLDPKDLPTQASMPSRTHVDDGSELQRVSVVDARDNPVEDENAAHEVMVNESDAAAGQHGGEMLVDLEGVRTLEGPEPNDIASEPRISVLDHGGNADDPEQSQTTGKLVKKKAAQLKGGGKSAKLVGKKKTAELPHSEQGKRPCFARHLIIAAHARGLCISRQINTIYDNPGTDRDCGRCSSCRPRPLPTPRPMPSPIPDTPESTAPPSDNAPDAISLPAYMKLTRMEVEELSQELNHIARRVWRTTIRGPESLLIGPTSFLRPDIMKHLTANFHLLSSLQDLEHRIRHNWRYWDRAGAELWSELQALVERFHEKAEDRHQSSLDNQRKARERRGAEAVRADLVSKGLDRVKRVRLLVAGSTSSLNNNNENSTALSSSPVSVREPAISPIPLSSPSTSANMRATTPELTPVRLAQPILSPSNRAASSSRARSHVDHSLGQAIPTERFYGTSQKTRKRAASPERRECARPPVKMLKTARGRKAAGAVSPNAMEGENTSNENITNTTAPPRRSKRIVRT